MFLKRLLIENDKEIIREIKFHKGTNLIIDETPKGDSKQSGNNVGKTTVLRIIDFCLAGDGKNLYDDQEFKAKAKNIKIEKFLKENNIIITLELVENLDLEFSEKIVIRRNFLNGKDKILQINGESVKVKDFQNELKRLIFNSEDPRPSFKEIKSKNIRDDENRLRNTINVLNNFTTGTGYEALFMFWFGIRNEDFKRKEQLEQKLTFEEKVQKQIGKENSVQQIEQFLIIVNRNIVELQKKKENFSLNPDYEFDLIKLNNIKMQINTLSTALSRFNMRKDLIEESKLELEKERANINLDNIRRLYDEALVLIPSVQKKFEDVVTFHNEMNEEKSKYITEELPEIEIQIIKTNSELQALLKAEKEISEKLKKHGLLEDLDIINNELNSLYEKKGKLEEQQNVWESSNKKIDSIKKELGLIKTEITSESGLLKERITEFNKYFSEISYKLYGEYFALSDEHTDKGLKLIISTIDGNPGTGKKKGQIAAFDLAYIQFADSLNIECLHFILHDQIENIHDNQITNILTDIVDGINCQLIITVLKDKLPPDLDVAKYEVCTLSQDNKLFKLP